MRHFWAIEDVFPIFEAALTRSRLARYTVGQGTSRSLSTVCLIDRANG